MNNVNKTLYIPLYGKALVSRKGILLSDPMAEQIWDAEGFPLKGKAASKWLAYYMGMRAAVFDRWVEQKIMEDPDASVLHLGCGMDSRAERVRHSGVRWYDVDMPEVIAQRRRYFKETEEYYMLDADLRTEAWLSGVCGSSAIVILEGVSMYLSVPELTALLARLTSHFDRVSVLMDCYTELAAKASRFKNPIHEVGVTSVFGLDDPLLLTIGNGLHLVQEYCMTPDDLIRQLPAKEQWLFRRLYAGRLAQKLYRMYAYGSERKDSGSCLNS